MPVFITAHPLKGYASEPSWCSTKQMIMDNIQKYSCTFFRLRLIYPMNYPAAQLERFLLFTPKSHDYQEYRIHDNIYNTYLFSIPPD